MVDDKAVAVDDTSSDQLPAGRLVVPRTLRAQQLHRQHNDVLLRSGGQWNGNLEHEVQIVPDGFDDWIKDNSARLVIHGMI